METVPHQAVQPSVAPHKYKYALFDDYAGERYLHSLLLKVAPLAVWRTWQAIVSYQAPGECCYVGVARLTDERDGRVNTKERKIYQDLAAMGARGWLTQAQVQKPFKTKDGSIVLRAVPVKDFAGLYDAAYAYHQWLESAEYIAPQRENIPLILADPPLTKRLIRFENYRRLLINAKPGRKARASHQDFYTCQLEKLAQESTENGQNGQNEPTLNVYLNTFTNEDALYRIPTNNQSIKERDPEDSTAQEGKQGVVAIRNFHPRTLPSGPHSNPNPKLSTSEEGQGGEAVQEVQYSTEVELRQGCIKQSATMAAIPADQDAKLTDGQNSNEPQQAPRRSEEQPEPVLPARPEREVPPAVNEEFQHYARQYDDAHLIQSGSTRLKKLYATAEQALPDFHEGMYWEHYDAAKGAAAKRARKCTNSKGFVTRVPYLFTCLENAFGFSLEEMVYLRSDDSLCADTSLFDVIDTMRDTYNRLVNTGQLDVEYRTWLCDILDEYEKRKEPKERLNATSHAYPCESPA